MSNFKRTFGNATSPLALSYLDDNFSQLEAAGTSTVTLSGAQLIGFMQSGTGAYADTAQNKMRQIVATSDFKNTDDTQVGTANANNATGLQRAIDALNTAGGGILYNPVRGTLLSGNLELKTGVAIRGCGIGANTLKLINSAGAVSLIQSTTGATDVGVEDITLDGNQANNATALMCLLLRSVTRYYVRNVKSINAKQDGLYLGGGSGSTGPCVDGHVLNYITDGCQRNGISVIDALRLKIDRPVILSAQAIGIDIEPNAAGEEMTAIVITDPLIVTSVNEGIQVNPGASGAVPDHLEIRNPVVLTTTGSNKSAIYIAVSNVTVQGGYLTGATGAGVEVVGDVSNIRIRGIHAKDNDLAGVRFTSGTTQYVGCEVTCSTLEGNGVFGINAFGLQNSLIALNTFKNNATTACRLADTSGGQASTFNTFALNTIFDDQGVVTQTTGFSTINNANNNIVVFNSFQNTTVEVSMVDTTKVVRGNIGYVTENSGTGTINSGATTATVSHGCGTTPTVGQINITFAEQGTSDYGRWWVSGISSSQFTLNVSADPGASNLDFGWSVNIV
jgi:hypothetical protein